MIPSGRNRACLGLKTDLAQEVCGTTAPERYYHTESRQPEIVISATDYTPAARDVVRDVRHPSARGFARYDCRHVLRAWRVPTTQLYTLSPHEDGSVIEDKSQGTIC
jgi:hypothetical protein